MYMCLVRLFIIVWLLLEIRFRNKIASRSEKTVLVRQDRPISKPFSNAGTCYNLNFCSCAFADVLPQLIVFSIIYKQRACR